MNFDINTFGRPRGGDMIFFSAHDFLARGIQLFTHSILSHSAMVLDPTLLVDGKPQTELHTIESTIMNGQDGVQIHPLNQRVAEYPGRLYWAPLSDRTRSFLNFNRMWTLAETKVNHDKYNVLEIGAYILRDVPLVQDLPFWEKPNPDEEVCSELCADLFAAGGLPGLSPYDMPPQKLAELAIYDRLVQLTGSPKSIRKFNAV